MKTSFKLVATSTTLLTLVGAGMAASEAHADHAENTPQLQTTDQGQTLTVNYVTADGTVILTETEVVSEVGTVINPSDYLPFPTYLEEAGYKVTGPDQTVLFDGSQTVTYKIENVGYNWISDGIMSSMDSGR